MLNILRADITRMFKSRSTWVILIIATVFMALFIGIMHYQVTGDYEVLMQGAPEGAEGTGFYISTELTEEQFEANREIMIDSLTPSGILAQLNSQLTGFMLLLMLVFAAVFGTRDYSTGFIKNLLPQPRYRTNRVLSKVVVYAVFNALTLLINLIGAFILILILKGEFVTEGLGGTMAYLAILWLLSVALSMIVDLVANMTGSTVTTVIVAVVLSMNLVGTLLGLMDSLDVLPVKAVEYTLVTNMTALPLPLPEGTGLVRPIAVGAIGLVVATILDMIVMNKRDVNCSK